MPPILTGVPPGHCGGGKRGKKGHHCCCDSSDHCHDPEHHCGKRYEEKHHGLKYPKSGWWAESLVFCMIIMEK